MDIYDKWLKHIEKQADVQLENAKHELENAKHELGMGQDFSEFMKEQGLYHDAVVLAAKKLTDMGYQP
jgi:hypothetical protein